MMEYYSAIKRNKLGNSLLVQWLGLSAFTLLGLSSISGLGTKIPQAMWRGQKKKKKEQTTDVYNT